MHSQRRIHRPAPSPLEGEGWGGGYYERSALHEIPPSLALPLKGGGNTPPEGRGHAMSANA